MDKKDIFSAITIFLIGYSLGKHKDSEFHVIIEDLISKFKNSKQQLSSLLVNILDRIETISSDEVNINFDKIENKIREKIEEIKKEIDENEFN